MKTRLLIVVFTLLSMTFNLTAAPRSKAEAKSLAERQLSISLMNSDVESGRESTTRSGEEDKYYIFDVKGGHGFVIVSADDQFEDILGYADTGSYDAAASNPAFEFWLNAISSDMDSNPMVSKGMKSQSARTAGVSEIAPLIKTTWGQDAPYNNYCWETGSLRPDIGWKPGHAPTGCVATAMAQIMNYHQWPPSFTDGDSTFVYKWDLMQSSYDGSESAESIDQVANLMSHCGKSVNMQYGATQSGASSFAVPGALVDKFGYEASTIRKVWRDAYSRDVVYDLLINELKENRPVIVGGDYPGVKAGHEFIIDGCNSDGLFHVNWGWDGYCDGYFRLTAMRPSDVGTGASHEGFSFNMDFTIGIQPAFTETDNRDAEIFGFGDLCLPWTEEETVETRYNFTDGIRVTTINGPYKGFMNVGASNFNGDYGENRGKIFTRLTNIATGEETIEGYYDYFVRGVKPGEYNEIYVFYPREGLKEATPYKIDFVFTNNNGSYKEIKYKPGCRSYLIIERHDESLTITQPRFESSLTGQFADGDTRLMRRSAQKLSVKLTNPGEMEYNGQVKCKFTDINGNAMSELTDYAMVSLTAGESCEEDIFFYNLLKAPAGIYKAALYDFRDRLISEPVEIELYDYKLELNSSNFPDSGFCQYLSDIYDIDKDGALSDQEINEVYVINLEGIDVKDLTGIDNFTNLYGLTIKGSGMTSFRLPVASRISQLVIVDTPIESLSLDELPYLDYIRINNSNLKELDLSGYPQLYGVDVDDNKLEKLILPSTEKLETLYCSDNSLEELDVSGLSNLYLLYISDNNISKIDISHLTGLQYFTAYNNQLESLDVRGLVKLQSLTATDNKITDFHIDSHPELSFLRMENNPLNCSLDLTGCPALNAIYLTKTGITELKLPELPELEYCYIYDNAISGMVDLSKSQKLKALATEDNGEIELNLGNLPLIENLRIDGSSIAGNVLDLTGSTNLTRVNASECGIKSLLLGSSPDLTYMRVVRNDIEGVLDISGLSGLTEFIASYNKIKNLRHSRNSNLNQVFMDYNELTHFHADDFPMLKSYSVENQTPSFSISTANFNTKNISGFESERASDWIVEWIDKGETRSADCNMISGVVRIPEEAGRDVKLRYRYLTDVVNDKTDIFTINLTRECFNSVDEILAEGAFSISGSTVSFAEGVSGEIYSAGGVRIYKGVAGTVPLQSGIYVVCIGNSSVKISIP